MWGCADWLLAAGARRQRMPRSQTQAAAGPEGRVNIRRRLEMERLKILAAVVVGCQKRTAVYSNTR